jgi:NAD(P)-dependent dehydrogenase (short-subunit alcohol dehydrogenase family)
MDSFRDKVAVITGAGSGFGREFARQLASAGAKLVLCDVQPDALAAVEAELVASGAEVLSQVTDVRSGAAVEALAQATIERFGTVHLLFNNAGVGAGGRVWENTVADWEWVLGVNLWGVIHGVRVFTPLMLAAAGRDPTYRGHIVNTSSVAGLVSAPGLGVYNVSKHGVVALSETLHHDLAASAAPIGVSVLCPGFVPTAISSSQRNRPAELRNERPMTDAEKRVGASLSRAVETGRISAAEVAQQTLDAVRAGRFYVFTHPDLLPAVKIRCDEVQALRNPTLVRLK